MNHDFKSKFGEMQDNQSGAIRNDDNNNLYAIAGHNRNICFAWPDGRLVGFSYAYLISSEYVPEESYIQLEFTTHKVLLKGYDLEQLYFQIFDQLARVVRCIEARYSKVTTGDAVVTEIIVAVNA